MLLALILGLGHDVSVDQILANVRRAVGFSAFESTPGYVMTGRTNSSGLDSNVRFVFGKDGSYLYSIDGPLAQARAWDGKSGWETDATGAPISLALSDLEHQHAISWVLDHEWLDPHGPFVITLDNAAPANDGYTLTLTQKGGIHVQKVIVDQQTWLPLKTSFDVSHMPVTYSVASWSDGGGFRVPKRVETKEGEILGWIEFDRPTPLDALPSHDTARPKWEDAGDTRWGKGALAVLETRLAQSGHILVKPTVSGEDVGWFILDSGSGGMAIDRGASKELGLKEFGKVNVGGVGGIVESGFVNVKNVQVGDLTLHSLNFIDIDLRLLAAYFGVRVGGIFGYEFFRRAVVEIDVETGRVAVFDPATYENPRAKWEPLVLDAKHPTYIAEFEGGHSGRFRLDTGAEGTVAFNTPTVERHRLLDGHEAKSSSLAGVGGSTRMMERKLMYFTLAGKKFENINAMFATEKRGVFAEDYLAGNIGQELLKPFVIVFDYPHERIALVPKD